MSVLIGALALAVIWLAWRLRRLERRLLDLQDRAIDWRLNLGRRVEELSEQLDARGGGQAAPTRPAAAGGEPLIQIRKPN